MKEKEKQLFKTLCKFKDHTMDENLLAFASPTVLGYLFFHRMQGIAYDTLKKHHLLGKVNREFRNSLAAAYEQNLQKNHSFCTCVAMLSEILSRCHCKVAMLKGAYLCAHYPDGYRTSNDIDLLTLPQNVTEIGQLLSNAGFSQGHIRNGEFVPASRLEIIESKMMRGETIPYIKQVDLPYMKFLEVDINFSLDYKNGEVDALQDMLSKSCTKNINGIDVITLANEDFFLHLCAHLYKEATTLPWIEMQRDMTLYKYCDIYMLLSEMSNDHIQKMFNRAKELKIDKICAYAILETMGLFDMSNDFAYWKAMHALENEPNFCLKVTSPKDNKTLIYQTSDVNKRFFMESRSNNLKEVETNESTSYAR